MRVAITLLFAFSLVPQIALASDARERFFADQVAPLLERACVGCHRGVAARGGLALDHAAGALRGGDSGPAVVPGDPDASLLVQMIEGDEPAMPQDGDRLPPTEIAIIREWIRAGANWPKDLVLQDKRGGKPWWSLTPLSRPELPKTPADNRQPCHPIDAFVGAKLRQHGLKQGPQADRATIIRRLTYDLHGLPPTPEELADFVNDPAADAYQRLVNRLLASPRYGERWARHWLDVVHYGDTHGYDKDKRRDHAWPYRDYVIRAFNDDLPYARFVEQQVAGDALAPDDPQALIATGFIAAGPWDFVGHVELREGTSEKAKTRALDRDDMVANTISTFTSMTAHCARCHDHAFDPISQLDYYRLQAVFAGVDRQDVAYEDRAATARRAQLTQLRDQATKRLAEIESQIQQLTSAPLDALDKQIISLQQQQSAAPDPLASAAAEQTSATNGYHSVIAPSADVVKWVQIDLSRERPIDAIRLIPARPTDFPDSPGFGFPVRFQVALSDDPDFHQAVLVDDQSAADVANPASDPYTIYLTGRRARFVRVTATRLWQRTDDYVFALAELQVESAGQNAASGATVTAFDSIEAGRWNMAALVDQHDSRRPLAELDGERTAALALRHQTRLRLAELRAERTARHAELVTRELDQARATAKAEVKRLTAELAALPSPQRVYAVQSHAPRPIHLLARGNVDSPGAEVGPGALACLPQLESVFPASTGDDEKARRHQLAHWLTHRDNVLTWRSIVNRVWHYHFGRGLVETPSDFGRNGAEPTHPELLDWLAVEFRDGGQSLKSLHRLIVTSAAWRQTVRHDDFAAARDAGNQSLWRMNRRRLEAEEIRDSILATSGKLDLTIGGPGFELFHFKDDHSPRYDPASFDSPAVWRRSIYRFITRSVPNPWLESLDCPDPSVAAPVRTTTITALQALATLNDEFVIRQSHHMADRLTREHADLDARLDHAMLLCLARKPTGAERAQLAAHASQHGLASVCRLLWNTNEFVFID
ncbi:MAG: DUF1553 domain-containing protein [Pirellulales bacterium]|nr:DUF1553 domain-containing protein [Pirellulales bacterium]